MSETDDNLNAEMDTIQKQINNVNATISSKERVIALNDSYSKKMSAYTRMVLAIVFALAIAVLLNMLKSKFDIIPSAVITIAYIILFSSSIFYSLLVLSDIDSREKTDFDKLDLSPPSGVSKNIQKISTSTDSTNFLPGYCIGKDCCTTAMAWDSNSQKCVNGCPSAGYYINSEKDCEKCAAGKYADADNSTSECTSCAAGTYSNAGAGTCTLCAAGTFSLAGASSCTDCPAGQTSEEGDSSCAAVQ
jgi:hypothetical protein